MLYLLVLIVAMHNSIIKVKNNNKTYTVTIEETPVIMPIVPQKIILIV
jgi:hypothetical protein